ncbi:DUF4407 domain-containing protein [Mycobacterium sp.]|uniref:DUF4407 domain-containing protein n=1 Tax=Mycobacterium sp. TaxID=1785 RepID=UPI003BB1EEBA
MCAHQVAEPRTAGSSISALLTWLGGADRRELNERHERSTHAVAGVVVLVDVVLTWLVTTLAVMPTVHVSALVVVPFTLLFALLVGATARAIATGPTRGAAGHGTTALAVVLVMALGGVVGEFAALALFSGSIERVIHQQAARNAISAPAVVQQSSNLQQMREARVALDQAVDAARAHRDEALVVARCEYHPTPACPQTRITGVPGSGPETRTANELLADSQQELDQAIAARDRRVPGLEDQISHGERVLDEARQSAIADADHDLGSRWVAMQQLTSAGAGTLALRLLTVGFFIALGVLPLILRRWRGVTSHDRHAQARAEREKAELEADTAIAVRRAEVRAAAETMWAEQQLEQARLAVEAQTEIDRAQLRHRVSAAIEVTTPDPEPVDDDIYLPIAAEAHAASLATPAPATSEVSEARNLPAIVEAPDMPATQSIPTIPDVTRAAARWIRPLVPNFVARAIDTSTHPLRTARQVIEEFEEITFSLRRTHKITVATEEDSGASSAYSSVSAHSQDDRDNSDLNAGAAAAQAVSAHRPLAGRAKGHSVISGSREAQPELAERDGPAELRAPDGPRQLPPAR